MPSLPIPASLGIQSQDLTLSAQRDPGPPPPGLGGSFGGAVPQQPIYSFSGQAPSAPVYSYGYPTAMAAPAVPGYYLNQLGYRNPWLGQPTMPGSRPATVHPNIDAELPAANLTNSTGGVGCEPGYNYCESFF